LRVVGHVTDAAEQQIPDLGHRRFPEGRPRPRLRDAGWLRGPTTAGAASCVPPPRPPLPTGSGSGADLPCARLASTRFFSAFIAGSRSLRSATSGVAMKIEEYAPAARPTNSDREMSFSMPAPRTPPRMNSSPATGSSATTVVLMERTRVLLIERLAISL